MEITMTLNDCSGSIFCISFQHDEMIHQTLIPKTLKTIVMVSSFLVIGLFFFGLHSASAFTNNEAATVVIGHASFTQGGSGTNDTAFSAPKGIAFDSSGNLWVADDGNNRVLMFPKGSGFTNNEAATIVIGHTSFTQGGFG